jgi:hypothetical protein
MLEQQDRTGSKARCLLTWTYLEQLHFTEEARD